MEKEQDIKKDQDNTENKNIKKEDVLEKDRKEKTPEQANQIIPTIMPTMIDESEERIGKVRNLSSIIPVSSPYQRDDNQSFEHKQEDIELISKENDLKGDGSTTLANIDENGEAILRANFALPEQIDIKSRKEEREKAKVKKVKKEKKKVTKGAQKAQNIMSLVSLVLIIFVGIVFYYWKTAPTEKDFTPLHVEIELGEKLPLRTSSYVKPGVGEVDELLYVLDLSNVDLEEAGDYDFTVTYKGVSKTGTVSIVDTTKPYLEVREVYVVEGNSYNAASFVERCVDFSGCNYSFQDSDTEKKYTTPGSYVVYVVATDAFQNSVTKPASLIIEAKGNVNTYVKDSGFIYDAGYAMYEKYELHYDDYGTYSILLTGTYTQQFTYADELKYEEARKIYNGEVNYTCDDSTMTITQIKKVNVVGSNYSTKADIDIYLAKEGYTQQS